ncbi:MAG: hypothetical protein J7L19_04415 [Dehalococcoidia bacterium]|nr:hypothetical protein [Dehalococcoidia bacterium]
MTTQDKFKAFLERTKQVAKTVEKKLSGTTTEQVAQDSETQKKASVAKGKKAPDVVFKETKVEVSKLDSEGERTNIMKAGEMPLEDRQLAEQLYNSAGLGPMVDAGLKDYDKRLPQEDKLINRMLGPRTTDMKAYGAAVAKRVAFAVYTLLNKQYGGKVGDLRSHIMALEEQRDRAKANYDELMGRVVGILGSEYRDLRIDSNALMAKLTATLGDNLEKTGIDHKALAESLADIDGLRAQIKALNKKNEQLKEKQELKIAALENEHREEIENLKSQIAVRDSKISGLELDKADLADKLGQSKASYEQLRTFHQKLEREHDKLKTASATVSQAVPYEEISKKLSEEMYAFLLKDSKVPGAVIEGVGKFINFEKYLGIAVDRGAREACKRAEKILGKASDTR